MPIVLEAKSQADFDAWLADKKGVQLAAANDSSKKWTFDELMAKGEEKYNAVCAMCHQVHGKGVPPTFPSLVGSDMVINKDRIGDHIRNVLYGKNAMPPFKDQLNDFDIAAIITYERNAWGNNTKDIVQPQDVKAVRDQGTDS
jgi:cytochrome c oxidase subunit 2